MDTFTPTERTTVRRLAKRGVYDKGEVYAILDEGFICHVGFAIDGRPYVIPPATHGSAMKSFCTVPPPAACCAP
jgi:hypothetical protein